MIRYALALSILAGCSDSVPDAPTWTADVRPILVANCARCHTYPAINGAPNTFRLDVLESTRLDDGFRIYGAGQLAEFIHQRTHAGTMPPRFPLSSRQRDVLEAWFDSSGGGLIERQAARANNREPSIVATADLASGVAGSFLTIPYRISDPDGDVTIGTLRAVSGDTSIRITRELHSGTGEAVWDFGAVAEGTYEIEATLDDGDVEVTRALGSFEVARPDDNLAPSVELEGGTNTYGLLDALFTDADVDGLAPVVNVEIADPNGDTMDVRIDLVQGEQVVMLSEQEDLADGMFEVTLDVPELPAGDNWYVVATVTDGNEERQTKAGPIAIAHGTTDLRYADVERLTNVCAQCHRNPSRIPDLGFGLTDYDEVTRLKGFVYRRAVLARTMPPKSAVELIGDTAQLSTEDREKLGEWLRAGAPQ